MLKYALIMPAFCSLLLPSYYSNNFVDNFNASLIISVLIILLFDDYIYVVANCKKWLWKLSRIIHKFDHYLSYCYIVLTDFTNNNYYSQNYASYNNKTLQITSAVVTLYATGMYMTHNTTLNEWISEFLLYDYYIKV